jgi:hypothetical protein
LARNKFAFDALAEWLPGGKSLAAVEGALSMLSRGTLFQADGLPSVPNDSGAVGLGNESA